MITRRDFLKVSAVSGLLATASMPAEAKKQIRTVLPDDGYANESERRIPVFAETDVLVIGGTSAGVAAAAAAAAKGRKVFLVAALPYLGDDICGAYRYKKGVSHFPETPLAQRIFKKNEFPLPLYVKTELEDELLNNDIPFLYSSYVTDILTGRSGEIAGAVIVSRSGRQAIKARTVIDATPAATVAALAGVNFSPFVAGDREYFFTTVGNNLPKSAPEIVSSKVFSLPVKSNNGDFQVIEYKLRIPLFENTYAAYSKAEQIARSCTWDKDVVDTSDLLWFTPEEYIRTNSRLTKIPASIANLSPEIFLADKNIWVLNACANMDRQVARELFAPVNAMALGACVGEYAASAISEPIAQHVEAITVSGMPLNATNYGKIKEDLKLLRPLVCSEWLSSPQKSLPVLGRYDVIVSGGGVSGAPAALSAARNGAKTLVLEYLHGLGGLGTLGMISVYWDGYREGFTKEVDEGVRRMAPADHSRQKIKRPESWDSLWKAEWYRKNILDAGGEIWFGAMGCGAVVEDNVVKGIVVATPQGRGIILANTVIDSSGSADIAIAAGAAYEYTGAKSVTVQGAGLPKIDPADGVNNTDWLFIDDTDIVDVTRVFVQGKKKYSGLYDIGKIPQTRERRRVIGEYSITVADIIQRRTFHDIISYHKSSFDTHGTTVDSYFTLNPPLPRHTIYDACVPLRSLLPAKLEGILVTGLGASAHRDAMPVIRMQSCLQNQGYAVGYLAARCAAEKLPLRKMDIKKIQKHLVTMGNLPQQLIVRQDSDPYTTKALKEAADKVTDNCQGLEILLSVPQKSIPLLQKKIKQTDKADQQLLYASILSILGNADYAQVLADKIKEAPEWDEGWHYTGMHQFGPSMSRLDSLIIALGETKREKHLPVILEKAALLTPEVPYSHFRAVAIACENIGSGRASETLWKILCQPGIQGQHIESFSMARSRVVPDLNDVSIRNRSLKEFHLARALYRCGDKENLGCDILKRYACGLEGHYARSASEILAERN
ncbi:MAG: FAD-dependent oxidoreductase [Bacteroidales bacterium]|nr:FAD-dependent oxidoreductase [Bacteroidales bacterium]